MNDIHIKMNHFEAVINYFRDVFRKEGITGMDSIKHSIFFILSKFLTFDTCKLYNIDNIKNKKFNSVNDIINYIKINDNNLYPSYDYINNGFYNKNINFTNLSPFRRQGPLGRLNNDNLFI
jgi:hypothetical protein